MTLAPGGEYRQTLLLDQWFDNQWSDRRPESLWEWFRPGEYQIEVRLFGSITDAKGVPVRESWQTTATVIVQPRDATALAAKCAELAERIVPTRLGQGSPERADAAFLALSYIDDQVAVPYLLKILRDPSDRFALLYLLRARGTGTGVEALAAAMQYPEPSILDPAILRAQPDLCRMAREALEHVAQASPKPAVRQSAREKLAAAPSDCAAIGRFP